MVHSFVAAKLSPNLPGWSIHGQRVAHSLSTTPFLALYIEENRNPHLFGPDLTNPNLFIISSVKPDMSNSEYMTLHDSDSDDYRTLTVIPPLPFQSPLYVFITPRIWCRSQDSATFERLAGMKPYQLSSTSLEKFRKAVKEAGPSIPGIRETGNGEQPPPGWETWSAYSRREGPGMLMLRKYVPLRFDLVSFTELPESLATDVVEQIALYRQLYLDYTWQGCRTTISYMQSMKQIIPLLEPAKRIVRLPSLNPTQRGALDLSSNIVRPAAVYLKTLPLLQDGDPNKNHDVDDDSDDAFDPLLMKAEVIPAAKAGKIKLVVLDCSCIINSDRVLSSALFDIFPPVVHQFALEELLNLYVEKETLLVTKGFDRKSPFSVIHELAHYLHTPVSLSDVQNAFARSDKPILYDDVLSSISSLVDAGYSIISLPLVGFESCRELVSQIPGLSLAFCDAVKDKQTGDDFTWDELLELCKNEYNFSGGISPNEVLVVTPDICTVAEPATLAGFPTALVQRKGSRYKGLTIPTFSPTYQVTGLGQILPILLDPDSVPPAKEPRDPNNVYPPYPSVRIFNCYQTTCMLGAGSKWSVWGGVQLITGDYVAIKIETTRKGKPSLLEYEDAVYAQLEGVRGLVRIRWAGVDQNARVLVMDRLGPNLECMRLFCRGKLSLKTVLMLGEQMLATIEEIHARGIIIRDIKPQNFALGSLADYKRLFLMDMGFAKLFMDPMTGEHMPFYDDRTGLGTPIFASHNVHLGLEPSRRDDLESIGFTLLFLIHGRLPWQGFYAPDVSSKLKEMGDMKRGKPMSDLLARSPSCFAPFFNHCRSLGFTDKPDYEMLKGLLREEMDQHGWVYDWQYDWWVCGDRGTLFSDEYKLEKRLIEPVRDRQLTL